MKKLTQEVLFSAIVIGILTFFYGLMTGLFSLWMGPTAFIAAALYAVMRSKQTKAGNVLMSFVMGTAWGLMTYALFQVPGWGTSFMKSLIFGVLTLAVVLIQGTLIPYTRVPAWLLSWGTFMQIATNTPIHNWPLFVIQLFACYLLGIYFLDYGGDYFKLLLYRWFPTKTGASEQIDRHDEL